MEPGKKWIKGHFFPRKGQQDIPNLKTCKDLNSESFSLLVEPAQIEKASSRHAKAPEHTSEKCTASKHALSELLQEECSGSSCPAAFIGLYSERQFVNSSWLDGSPFGGSFYSNWNSGEPNNFQGSETCVEMTVDTGKWNDVPEYVNRIAVCKSCQPLTTTSTTTTTTTTATRSTTATPSTTTSTITPTTSPSTTVSMYQDFIDLADWRNSRV